MKKTNLRIPGPTPMPLSVRKALSRQMINHRGEEFSELIVDVTKKLQKVFQTKNDIVIFPSAGTGAMEATIVNLFNKGDSVVIVQNGVFGNRFAQIARIFGVEVIDAIFADGKAAEPEVIEQILKKHKNVRAVIVTHNETSTGIMNDLEKISQVLEKENVLYVVDSESSMGAVDIPVDKLGIDIALAGSQKAWMAPPGVSMISVSSRALQMVKKSTMPRYYWDFQNYLKYFEKGQTPYTPAVSTLFALQAGLDLILKEGIHNVFKRHERLARLTRQKAQELGLRLYADEDYASSTVTAVYLPKGVSGKEFRKTLKHKHGIEVAGGQGHLADKIFRIGHLGNVKKRDIIEVFEAVANALNLLGVI